MEQEEADPGLLVGRHVVEVGMRQGNPYLTFADPVSGREVRVYIDAAVRVSPDRVWMRQDDDALLPALDRLNMSTVDSVHAVGAGLELTLEDRSLWIDGEVNELSAHEPWRVGLQSPGTAPLTRGTGAITGGSGDLMTPAHLPVGFTYPAELVRVVEHGLVDLEPWNILTGERLAQKHLGLRKRYPSASLVPFASRTDNDDVACWDMDLPRGRVVIIHDWASPGWERGAELHSTTSWIRQAVEDFIGLDG